MDKPISVGDMVMVVRSCCDRRFRQYAGLTFRVGSIGKAVVGCGICDWHPSGNKAFADKRVELVDDWIDGSPVLWLKRIPPLEELEGADSWEELNTPVLL